MTGVQTCALPISRSIDGYFDTTTGPKKEPESYRRIAREIGAGPADVLFISDSADEVAAALQAGLRAVLCVREGTPTGGVTEAIRSFEDLQDR